MSPDKNKTLTGILFVVAVCLLLVASSAEAAIKSFIAQDNSGSFFEYSYSDLLDSYALKIVDLSNGLYEDFSAKKTYAFLDSSGRYFDYQATISYYANALLNKKPFDLQRYFNSPDSIQTDAPLGLVLVNVKDGKLNYGPKTTAAGNSGPPVENERPANTPIVGLAMITVDQAQKWSKSRGAAQSFIDIAPLYWDYGLLCGMRPEVLYAQAAVETNFGRYGNRVPAEYNNWAGIKTAAADGNSAEDHEKFDSPEEGVRAHYNHMSAYVGLQPVDEPHGRYHLAVTQPWAGTIQYVESLSTTWTPLADYHTYIIALIDQMLAVSLEGQQPSPPDPAAENQQPPSVPSSEDSPTELIDKVFVDVDVLRLRGGPSTDHEILDRLFLGTMLQVLGNQNEWLKVITPDGKNGWVHGAYVRRITFTSTSLAGKKIVIDPGHGGSDPGATGTTGVKEKTVNLIVAEKLIKLLHEAGATVLVTRSGDQTVNNQRRIDLINSSNADIMVSIHTNAFSNPESNGTETFYCARNSNSAASRALAIQLQREMVAALGLRNRGVKESSFFVLTNSNIPSALIELAFISNPDEERILLDPGAQERAAVALYRGIEAYFHQKH